MTWKLHFFAAFLLAGLALTSTPAAARQHQTIPEKVEQLHRSDSECRDYDAKHMLDARVVAKLADGKMLYLLPCYTGAYNIIYSVYVFDKRYPDELKRSVFAGFSDDFGWYGKDSLINADFDPKTQTLSAFEKGRGLGDCGSIPSYQWSDYGWRMIEYRYWAKCDGTRMPEDWPVIYRFKKAGQ